MVRTVNPAIGLVLISGVLIPNSTSWAQWVYWADSSQKSIHRACLTGLQPKKLFELSSLAPQDIAFDPVEAKLYWPVRNNNYFSAIQRANLDGSGLQTFDMDYYGTATAMAVDPVGRKFYWADQGYDKIERANLDGTSREIVVQSNQVRLPSSLALDIPAGKVYWVDTYGGSIRRVNMAGGGIENVIPNPVGPFDPVFVAVDSTHGKLYWTGLGGLHRANLDGTQIENLNSIGNGPIALAPNEGKVYWIGTSTLLSANLDGTNAETLITMMGSAAGLALDLAPCGSAEDCQNNGTSDDCEICAGTSLDCNLNDVPDECDLADGISPDCNANLVPDECDLASGSSMDCNFDRTPDECESNPYCANQGHACEVAILPDFTLNQGACFGKSVDLRGGLAAVGAWGQDSAVALRSGVVNLFRQQGRNWITEAHLSADDAQSGAGFGFAVAIDDGRLVVGASSDDGAGPDSGAAYVFQQAGNVWVQETKLQASDGFQNDYFGFDVAIDGDVIVVTSVYKMHGGIAYAGVAYVYRRTAGGWVEEAKLAAPIPVFEGIFGKSAAISGPNILVGAYTGSAHSAGAGAAYAFHHDGQSWAFAAEITPVPVVQRGFGGSISMDGNLALVGASTDGERGKNAGAAYLFNYANSSWSQLAKLIASDARPNDYFGDGVSLRGSLAVVSSRSGNDSGPSSGGQVYWFSPHNGKWTQEGIIKEFNRHNGYSVAVDNATVLIGSASCGSSHPNIVRVIATAGSDCDADNVYDDCDPDCNHNDVSDICDIQASVSADVLPVGGNRIPDECEIDCNGNGIPDLDDIADHTSNDCNHNSVPDECDTDSGNSIDCDANGVPDECQPDCNQNQVPDVCDISSGNSNDCNQNATPDECEADCNQNGVADSCDIADVTSLDLNANGYPDECEPLNDLCANATGIESGHYSFDTSWANTDGNPYLYECGVICEGPCMQNDVWYDLTTPCSSVVNITPDASMYGYTIIVYEGCHCPAPWGNWETVGCNWLFGGPIQFSAGAGTCYKIRVGNAYEPGGFTLSVTPPCDVTGNGDFDDDGDVDEDDYADFPNCMTAPNGATAAAYPSRCRPFDSDADNAIDLRDAAEFLRVVQMQLGAILHVPSGYATIQQAIDAAGDHDTVLVAPGTYVEDINFVGKPIHVLAERFLSPVAPASTIIEGTGSTSVVTFDGTESLSALLAGFTVTGGNATKGGGVLGQASRARLQNCIVTVNTAASDGAGVHDLDGRIDDCAITGNVVTSGFGGGISRCDGVIRNTLVSDNSARFGGGIYDSQATITGCQVKNNAAEVGGGGLGNCSGLIERCVISHNVCGNSGGGLYGCDGTIRSCLISGNRAALGGGGLSRCSGLVTNCTVVGNRLTYGGVNSGHAISYCEGEILNSIFWDNFTPFGYFSVTPKFSVVPPGSPAGSGNVYSNPLFHSSGVWDPSGYWIDGDYHLSPNSPCRDSGDPTYLPSADEKDLDGNSRVVGPQVDIGAYELVP